MHPLRHLLLVEDQCRYSSESDLAGGWCCGVFLTMVDMEAVQSSFPPRGGSCLSERQWSWPRYEESDCHLHVGGRQSIW